MTTTFRLLPHKYKKIWAISATACIVLAVIQLVTGITITTTLPSAMHALILLVVGFLCLANVAMCQEKIEDERTKQIRAKVAMQVFFFLSILAVSFSVNIALFPFISPEDFIGISFTKEDYSIAGIFFMAFPALAILYYITTFHIYLSNDELMDYTDKQTRKEYFKKNKTYIILRTLTSLGILAAIIIMGRMSK